MSALQKIFVLLSAVSLLACASTQTVNSTLDRAAPAHMHLASSYRIYTRLDPATITAMLHEKWGATLLALGAMEANPARTAAQLAILHKLVGVDEVLSMVPNVFRSRAEEAVNEKLTDALGHDGMSFAKGISNVIKSLLDLTRVVALETELSLNVAGGAVRGRHSLKALGLDGVGFLNLDVGGDWGTADVPRLSVTAEPASLWIAEHKFDFRLGEAALALFARQYKTDLATRLEGAVPCEEIATRVGGICRAGLCISDAVSNETLTSSCRTGVRIAAHTLEDEVRSLRLMLLDIREGRCKLRVGPDGLVESLVDGHFTLAITVKGEEFFSEVPFEGRRVNESAATGP